MPPIRREAQYINMVFHTVAFPDDPLQKKWDRYLLAQAELQKYSAGTEERTRAAAERNAAANAFVRGCVFFDPETGKTYEGAEAAREHIFRTDGEQTSKKLYVGTLNGDVKDTMFFPMTIGENGSMSLSDEPLKYSSYPHSLKSYLLEKNPTSPGLRLGEYVSQNYDSCPTLANIHKVYKEDPRVKSGEISLDDVQEEEISYRDFDLRTDPASPLRTLWDRFEDTDRLYKNPGSEQMKNHPEDAEKIRKDFDAKRRQFFGEFLSYAEFIEPSTGRVLSKDEVVWKNQDLNSKDPVQLREPGPAGYRSEKGYLLVRDPKSDPADGQVFVFRHEGSSYTLEKMPLTPDRYPRGYAGYLKSKTGLDAYDIYGKIRNNLYIKPENADLSDEMAEAAGEFFERMDREARSDRNRAINAESLLSDEGIEAAGEFFNMLENEKEPEVKVPVQEEKQELKEFLGYPLDFSSAKRAASRYSLENLEKIENLTKELSRVDKSWFPSQKYQDMVDAFKEIKDTDSRDPLIRNALYNDLIQKAELYISYKDPNGNQDGLSDYEKSRVRFAKSLLDFGKAGAENTASRMMEETADCEILNAFSSYCKARVWEEGTLEENAKFLADGTEVISKISEKYPAGSDMHRKCFEAISTGPAVEFQQELLWAAAVSDPVSPETIERLPGLDGFSQKYQKLRNQAEKTAGFREEPKAKESPAQTYESLGKALEAVDKRDKYAAMVKEYKALKDIDQIQDNNERQVRFNRLSDAAKAYLDDTVPEGKEVKLSEVEKDRVKIAKDLLDFGKKGVKDAKDAEIERALPKKADPVKDDVKLGSRKK